MVTRLLLLRMRTHDALEVDPAHLSFIWIKILIEDKMTSKATKKSSGYFFYYLSQIKLINNIFVSERNFKIAKGAVVCSEALLIGDITIGT